MKCAVCRGPAVIDLRRHNANFCADHFLKFCRDQVVRAIDEHDMIQPGERVLVAVSGGKDSLALWDLLLELYEDIAKEAQDDFWSVFEREFRRAYATGSQPAEEKR